MKSMIKCEDAWALLLKHPKIVLFDTETTGLYPKKGDKVFQFSACLIEYKNGRYKVTEEFDILINPNTHIPSKVTEITGKKDEDLVNAPLEDVAFLKIRDFLNKGNVYSGYNVKFDIGFMDEMFMRQTGNHFSPENVIDVMSLAKELVSINDVDGHFKLENVAKHYQVAIDGFHNAMIDVRNTVKVFFAEIKQYGKVRDQINKKPFYKIYSMRRWKVSREMDRLYLTIETEEKDNFIKLYYDFYKNEFISENNDFNPSFLMKEIVEIATKNGLTLSGFKGSYKNGNYYPEKEE